MIHAGEVPPGRRGKAVERARADENAVRVKQGRRAGTGMENGNRKRKNRPAAATVGRRAAFRKTRTATVFSLTEGPPKRKFFL